MTSAVGDEVWVHCNVATRAVYRATMSLGGKKQLAECAGAGTLRSRAERVTLWDGSKPIIDFGELSTAFWQGALSERKAGDPFYRTNWFDDDNWSAGIVGGILLRDNGLRKEALRVKAHQVEFCAQDLVRLYAFEPHVRDALLKGIAPPRVPPRTQQATPAGPPASQRVLPPLSEAGFTKWWADLERRGVSSNLNQDELWALAKAAHPQHSVARARIEAKTGGRKRGPRT